MIDTIAQLVTRQVAEMFRTNMNATQQASTMLGAIPTPTPSAQQTPSTPLFETASEGESREPIVSF